MRCKKNFLSTFTADAIKWSFYKIHEDWFCQTRAKNRQKCQLENRRIVVKGLKRQFHKKKVKEWGHKLYCLKSSRNYTTLSGDACMYVTCTLQLSTSIAGKGDIFDEKIT